MNPNKQIQTGHPSGAVQQISTHQLEIRCIKTELKQTHEKSERLARKLKKMLNHTRLEVSDHAVIRYLERAKGMDVDQVRNEILTAELSMFYKMLGDGELPLDAEGYAKAVVKDGVVITILI